MRKLEQLMKWLTDMDWGWWPVVHLRPRKERDIDNSVLLKMTAWFGTWLGIIAIVLQRRGDILSPGNVAVRVVAGWVAFFFIYKFTFAICWNKRAKRLRQMRSH